MSEQDINLLNNNSAATAPVVQQVAEEDESSSLNFMEIFYLFVRNWKWFLLSLVIVMTGATYHILSTTPIYTRSATILIKEEGMRGSGSTRVNWFNEMNSGGVNVNNEIYSLKSPSMFIGVVNKLNLNVYYTKDGMFHQESLYGRTLPVDVQFQGLGPDQAGGFDLLLKSNGGIEMSNFSNAAEKKIAGQIGKTYKTPLGNICVLPRDSYSASGEDVLIHVFHNTVLGSAISFSYALSAVRIEETTLIRLTFCDSSTERAEDIINTLIDVYNESWVNDKNAKTLATADFIKGRLDVIEKELGDVDSDISDYQSDNLLTDVKAVSDLYLKDAHEANKKSLDLNNQITMARYIRNYVAKDDNKHQLLPSNSGIGNINIESMINKYNDAVLEYKSYIQYASENHPAVVRCEDEIASLRSNMISSLDNQIGLLEQQLKVSEATERESKSGIAASPEQARYLLSVERQRKVKEALFIFLLQKREETELSQAFTAYNTRVISNAMGSNAPVSPVKKKILAMALAIALGVPAVLLYLIEIFNTRVRGRKDIERLKAPFVGEIPFAGTKKELRRLRNRKNGEEHQHIVVKHHSRNIINEAFRVIRTNIEFMAGTDEQRKVVMVTSLNPGSGKTYVAVNLASSFAIKQKRTLVLDLDLRRASASTYVQNPPQGVSNYLTGRVEDWHDLVRDVPECEELKMIPVGTLPPNPSELLSSPRLVSLLDQLREEYDMVFVDCPPMEIVADTSIIAEHVDSTLFIIRAGLMERELLSTVDNYYTQHKLPNLSVLLNGCTAAYGRYGYHSYGYHYGYGYSYSDNDE